MYTIIINNGGKITMGRRFEDNGAGKLSTRKAAIEEFNEEVYSALKAPDLIPCDFELELLDTSTGKVISRYFTKGIEPMIDRTEAKDLA